MLPNDFEITNTLACDTVNINMTSLQGTIKTTYDEIVKVFGHPTMTDGDPYEKVNAQWSLEFKVPFTDDTGIEDFETVTATIYNCNYIDHHQDSGGMMADCRLYSV